MTIPTGRGPGRPVRRVTPVGHGNPCPRCGSRDIARILRGYPVPDPAIEAEVDARHLVRGGCVMEPIDPDLRCNACGREWVVEGALPES